MATSLINTECKRYGCRKNLLACYANCRYNTRCDELRSEVEANFEQATTDINTWRNERGMSLIQLQMPKRGLKFVDVKPLSATTPRQKSVATKPKAEKPVARLERQSPRPTIADKLEVQTTKPSVKRRAKKRRAKVRVTKPAGKAAQKLLPLEPLPEPQVKPLRVSKAPKRKKRKSITENRIRMPRKSKEMAVEAATDNRERLLASVSDAGNSSPSDGVKIAAPQAKRSGKTSATKKPKKYYIVLEGERGTLVDESGLMKKLLAGVTPGARFFEASEMEVRLQLVKK